MKVSGTCKLAIGTEEVIKYGAMAVSMKVTGRTIKPMAGDD